MTILKRTRFEGVLGTFKHTLSFERGNTSRFGEENFLEGGVEKKMHGLTHLHYIAILQCEIKLEALEFAYGRLRCPDSISAHKMRFGGHGALMAKMRDIQQERLKSLLKQEELGSVRANFYALIQNFTERKNVFQSSS